MTIDLPTAHARALELYEHVHADPELSGEEERTASRFGAALAGAGLRVTHGIGGHGVVGVLDNGRGPTVLVRAELDALPLQDGAGPAGASTTTSASAGEPPRAMHACGHDLHLAALAGAADVLAQDRSTWRGRLVVVGQPAEETLEGAAAMLADGLFDLTGQPDVVLAQHSVPLPAGMIAHGGGPMLAGSATLRVTLRGRGGHAATPHLTVDPAVVAASVVMQLQTVVSRAASPNEPVIVNVGRLRVDSPPNVIPETATIELTVRAVSESTLARLLERVRAIVRGQCTSAGCPEDPVIVEIARSPVTQPDADVTAAVRSAHAEHFGAERLTWWPPALATEDVAHLTRHGAALGYWMLGCVGPREWAAAPGTTALEKLTSLPPNHSPRFAPDAPRTLATGIDSLVVAVGALGHR
ncbi:amidohydrolase [Cellulosimicrobium sp. PMB13]|uniref:amidohydrolase n=1 Tax=Cellulosimicrobium sp. PMB13 TaxID=3120158 RepID=UPI003F4C1A7A